MLPFTRLAPYKSGCEVLNSIEAPTDRVHREAPGNDVGEEQTGWADRTHHLGNYAVRVLEVLKQTKAADDVKSIVSYWHLVDVALYELGLATKRGEPSSCEIECRR